MKKLFYILTAIIVALSFSSVTYALTINQIATGDQEDFSNDYWDDYGLNLLQKYDVDENKWFAEIPPALLTTIYNTGDWTSGNWSTKDPSIEYFSIKAGNPKSNGGGGFILYQISAYNLGTNVQWSTSELNNKELSHIAWWGKESSQPIPEPATMLLFGAGLAGLAGVARKKRT